MNRQFLQNQRLQHELQNLGLWDDIKSWSNYLYNIGTPTDMPADFYKTIQQIVEDNGFDFKSYPVTTADGYHLNMFRIRSKAYLSESRPAVMMQHGLMSAGNTFTSNGAQSSAFLIAAAGYDVWLGNNRGNLNSMEHNTLSQTLNP